MNLVLIYYLTEIIQTSLKLSSETLFLIGEWCSSSISLIAKLISYCNHVFIPFTILRLTSSPSSSFASLKSLLKSCKSSFSRPSSFSIFSSSSYKNANIENSSANCFKWGDLCFCLNILLAVDGFFLIGDKLIILSETIEFSGYY